MRFSVHGKSSLAKRQRAKMPAMKEDSLKHGVKSRVTKMPESGSSSREKYTLRRFMAKGKGLYQETIERGANIAFSFDLTAP